MLFLKKTDLILRICAYVMLLSYNILYLLDMLPQSYNLFLWAWFMFETAFKIEIQVI